MSHYPVMLNEIIEFFSPCSLLTFIDGTLGGGGHAQAILSSHPEIKKFVGIDRDEEAISRCVEKLKSYKEKLWVIHGNFRDMKEFFQGEQFDGILLDLGISSYQLDEGERGFSFLKEGPLDMRTDLTQTLTAKSVVNTLSEKELGDIFREYGEERKWRKAAKAIVEARRKKKISTTKELCDVLYPVLGGQTRKIHPATLIFQALRIYVNDELNALKEGITSAISLLKPRGRLLVISFHSLEDRIVKYAFREAKHCDILTKKPLEAKREEIKINKRSRSAKLRAIEKCEV